MELNDQYNDQQVAMYEEYLEYEYLNSIVQSECCGGVIDQFEVMLIETKTKTPTCPCCDGECEFQRVSGHPSRPNIEYL